MKLLFASFALIIIFIQPAEAGRIARLPRQKLKVFEAGLGSPRGLQIEITVNCLNLSAIEQKLDVTLDFEVVKANIAVETPMGVKAPWQQNTPHWFTIDYDISKNPITGRPKTKSLTLKPMGHVLGEDSKDAYFGFSCAYRTNAFECANGSPPDLFDGFDFGKVSPTNKCTGITNCLKDNAVFYETVPKIELHEGYNRGAILCSLFISPNLNAATNQVAANINMQFNGGRPF